MIINDHLLFYKKGYLISKVKGFPYLIDRCFGEIPLEFGIGLWVANDHLIYLSNAQSKR